MFKCNNRLRGETAGGYVFPASILMRPCIPCKHFTDDWDRDARYRCCIAHCAKEVRPEDTCSHWDQCKHLLVKEKDSPAIPEGLT